MSENESSEDGEEETLFDCIMKGNFEKFKILAETQDINGRFRNGFDSSSLLIVAIKRRQSKIVKYMLQDKKDIIDLKNGKKCSYYGGCSTRLPFYYVLREMNPLLVKYFLENPDLNLNDYIYEYSSSYTKTFWKKNAIDLFWEFNNYKVAKVFVKYGVNIFYKKYDISTYCKSNGFDRIKKLGRILKDGWNFESHKYFPILYQEYAKFLFLYDIRMKYIPNEIKSLILSYIPIFKIPVFSIPIFVEEDDNNEEDEEESSESESESGDEFPDEYNTDMYDHSDDDKFLVEGIF